MDLSTKTILFIGTGNMGSALIMGLQKTRTGKILLHDIDKEKARALAQKTGAEECLDLKTGMALADIVVLAIKPQSLDGFLLTAAPLFRSDQTLISILAGINTQKLTNEIPSKPSMVRAMPNTPALVSQGMTAICGKESASLNIAEKIFLNVGEVLIVDEESMDSITAVSGSGPAYLFYFTECLIEAAKAQGFNEDTSKKLVYKTLSGSLSLLLQSNEAPESLRQKVTSKGGTTEAALNMFEKLGFKDILIRSVSAARERSKQMGK